MCASHTGTDEHVRVLKGLHEKVGISLENLQCGVHWPSDKETTLAMRMRGEEPNSYRHNCSGKHSGMLAHAKMRELSLDNYLEPVHPVQQTIRQTVAACAVSIGTISLPTAVPPCLRHALEQFAWAAANY